MKLLPEVSAKYKLVGLSPGKYQFANYGELDLTTIDLKEADALVRIGFPYLVLKKKN